MANRAIFRELTRLAWPVLIAQIAVMLYGVADTVMAGRYSTLDLAAVGIGASIYISVFMATVGVLLALMPIASQLYGAGKYAAIGEQVRQTVWLGVVLTLAAVTLLFFPEPFIWLTQAPPAVEAKVRAYLHTIAWGIPAMMFFRVFSSFSTAVSLPRVVMMLNLLGLACKVPLTWVLLNGYYGAPELGAVGCAVATVIASWLTCIAGWIIVARNAVYRPFGVFERASRPDWRAIGRLAAVGFPIGATFFVDVTAFTFMTLFIARLGAATSGAHQIAANFAALLFMLPLALGNATGVLVGQAIGAQDLRRARATGLLGIGLGLAVGLVLAAALGLARHEVAALYSLDPTVRAAAAALLALVAIYHVTDAVQAVAVNALRGYKRTLVPMIVATVALWGLGLGGGYWLGLASPRPLGAQGFWIAAIVSLGLAALALTHYFVIVSRLPDLHSPRPAPATRT